MTAYIAPDPRHSFVSGIDRCDRCTAPAKVRVMVLFSRLPLLFCGHHYTQLAAALSRVAVVTHDDREPAGSASSMLEVG